MQTLVYHDIDTFNKVMYHINKIEYRKKKKDEAFDKICKCIYSSNTHEHFISCKNMISSFEKIYGDNSSLYTILRIHMSKISY